MTSTTRAVGYIAAVLYLATIVAANWLVDRYGIIHIPFGFMAPAGVYMVGLAFTLRDVVQRALGKRVTVACILAGTALSALVSPTLALASGSAFLVSELADFVTFTWVVDRGLPTIAVLASNLVGAILDSMIFLWIAFGSLEFLEGQVVGKMLMTFIALPAVWLARRWLGEADATRPRSVGPWPA